MTAPDLDPDTRANIDKARAMILSMANEFGADDPAVVFSRASFDLITEAVSPTFAAELALSIYYYYEKKIQ